ncbi:MAG: PfkB family carbohydrate kinase [Gemmatimonadota bacterium]
MRKSPHHPDPGSRKEPASPFRPLIFGEALFDQFPDGSRVLGGAPFNVAWHLRGFEARPLMITSVGRDREGKEILERMVRWGMDTTGVQRHPARPTGRVTAHIEDGEPSYEIEARQAYDAVSVADLPPDTTLSEGEFLYHGTLALREATSAGALGYLRASYGFPTLVDVNLRDPWWSREEVLRRLEGTTWVKLNRDEAGLLSGAPVAEVPDLEKAGDLIRRRNRIENLVITLGEDGSMALTSRGVIRQKAAEVTGGVDSVGAGDAFAAVLALGIHEAWPMKEILERASRFAADICGIRGATTDDPELYSRNLRSWDHAS